MIPAFFMITGDLFFVHKQAKLKQRNITDTSGTLVTPWLEYDNLRTGTVVLMSISLRIYPAADRIKIVLPSDEPVDIRTKKMKTWRLDREDKILLKSFDDVAEPVKEISSGAALVRFSSITFQATST
jgi:hypothetical protein